MSLQRYTQCEEIPSGCYLGIDDLEVYDKYAELAGVSCSQYLLNNARFNLRNILEQIWGQEKVITLTAADIRNKLHLLVDKVIQEHPELLPLSLDSLFWPNCLEIHVNRISDSRGVMIGYGPRPNEPSLDKQADAIAQTARDEGKDILLVEDLMIKGGTLAKVIEMFHERGICTPVVAAGAATETAIQRFHDLGIVVYTPYLIKNPIDAVYFRDVIPGSPRGGLVIGNENADGSFKPCTTKSRIPFRPPYSSCSPIMDSSVVKQWAGIPKEWEREFCDVCWKAGEEIYSGMKKKTGSLVTLRDLVTTDPSLSGGYPGFLPQEYNNSCPDPNTSVAEVINNGLRQIQGLHDRRGTIYSYGQRSLSLAFS